MKGLILALLLIAYTASQPGALRINPSVIQSIAVDRVSFGSTASSTPSAPSADMAMDSSTSDSANVPSSGSSSGSSASMIRSMPVPMSLPISSGTSSGSNLYQNANNAWNQLQRLGGGCCDNCNKICGFAIKIYNTNNYLTNMGSWYQFRPSTNLNASQIFTLGQNADCTWSFSNRGSYLSTTTIYSGTWVGPVSTIGANERWHIERGGPYVYIQSAAYQYWYWRASSAPNYFLGYNYGSATRLVMEYYPCDKNFGWNW